MKMRNNFFKIVSTIAVFTVAITGVPISPVLAADSTTAQGVDQNITTPVVSIEESQQEVLLVLPPPSKQAPLQEAVNISPLAAVPTAEASLTRLDTSIDLNKKPYYFTADADTNYSISYDDTTKKNYLVNKQTSAKVEIPNISIMYQTINPKHLEVNGKVYLQIWHRMGTPYIQYKLYDTQAGTWQNITLNDYGLAAKDPVLLAGFTPWTSGVTRAESMYEDKVFALSADCSKVMVAENKAQGAVLKIVSVPRHVYAPTSPGYIAEMGGKLYYVYQNQALQTMKVEIWADDVSAEPVGLPAGWTVASSNSNFAFHSEYGRYSDTLQLMNLVTGQVQNLISNNKMSGEYFDTKAFDVSPDGQYVTYGLVSLTGYGHKETVYFQSVSNLAVKFTLLDNSSSADPAVSSISFKTNNLLTLKISKGVSGSTVESTFDVTLSAQQIIRTDLRLVMAGATSFSNPALNLTAVTAAVGTAGVVYIFDSTTKSLIREVALSSYYPYFYNPLPFKGIYQTPDGAKYISVAYYLGASNYWTTRIIRVSDGRELILDGKATAVTYAGNIATYTLDVWDSNGVQSTVTKRVNLDTLTLVESALEEKANEILAKYVTVVKGMVKVDYYGIYNSVISYPVNADLAALIALKLVTEYDKTPTALLNIRGYGAASINRGIYLLSKIAESSSESLDMMQGLTKSLKDLQASVTKINEKQALKAMIAKMETRVVNLTEAKKILDIYVKYVPHPNSHRYGWYEIDYEGIKNALLALPLSKVGVVGAELMNYMRKHLNMDGNMSSSKALKLTETLVASGWRGKYVTFLLINDIGKLKNYYWPEDGMDHAVLVDLMQEMRGLMSPAALIGW